MKIEKKSNQVLILGGIILLSLVIFSYVLAIEKNKGFISENSLYQLQAQSFLNGKINLEKYYFDSAVYNEKVYVTFPPLPAIILMPFVKIFGISLPLSIITGLFLTLLNILILKKILKKIEIDEKLIPWLLLAFFLGTAYWFCAIQEGTMFAQIVGTTFLLLGINESFGKGRGWLIGLFIGAAFLSRQMLMFSSIFILILLWENINYKENRIKILNIILFLITLGLSVGIYLLFNYIRFGNMLDTGYNYFILDSILKPRVDTYGTFNMAYFPSNFLYTFLQGFNFGFDSPTHLSNIQMSPFGTSLTFASPFVFLAILAKWKKSILYSAWISIAIICISTLFYYVNGWVQYNCSRYTLDFMPILILLIGKGMMNINEKISKSLIIYSIILNCIALTIFPILNIIIKLIS